MYQIVTDGSCDLTKNQLQELNVLCVPFYVSLDSKTHLKEGVDIKVRDFYQFMVDNPKVFPKSSMPSIQDYIDVYEPILKRGEDILSLCLTSKFSGSYNSANNAKNMLLEKYPDRKIEVIDSKIITVLQGMLVIRAVKLKEEGYSLEDNVNYLEDIKESGRIFFTIGGMSYLVNGGRVGKLSGIAAGALGLRPLILFENGELTNGGVVRGRKISLSKTIDKAIEYFKDNNYHPNDFDIVVGFGYEPSEADEFRFSLLQKIKEAFPDYNNDEIHKEQIGATIGVHTGPHPLGLGILKK